VNGRHFRKGKKRGRSVFSTRASKVFRRERKLRGAASEAVVSIWGKKGKGKNNTSVFASYGKGGNPHACPAEELLPEWGKTNASLGM